MMMINAIFFIDKNNIFLLLVQKYNKSAKRYLADLLKKSNEA